MILVESMKTFRLIGIVLASIGWAILVSGAVITIVLANTNPDYNYSSYMGFRFPDWLYFVASMIGVIGSLLIFVKGKAKQNHS